MLEQLHKARSSKCHGSALPRFFIGPFRDNVRRKTYSIRMATTFTFLYVIVNAFTDSAFGGNPASCSSRFSSPGSLTADSMLLAAPTKTSIAQCFVQLTTLFLSSSIHTEVPDSDENRVFDILFVLDKYFTLLCGHGTFAATKAICRGMFRRTWQGTLSRNSEHQMHTIVCSRAMDPGNRDSAAGGEFYELTIPVVAMQEVTEAERGDVRKMLGKGCRHVGLK